MTRPLDVMDELRAMQIAPPQQDDEFEQALRPRLGLRHRYDSARLAMGRSLAEPTPPRVVDSSQPLGRPIRVSQLFPDDLPLWVSLFVLDAELDITLAGASGLRQTILAHWHRGVRLLRDEFAAAGEDDVQFILSLCAHLPVVEGSEPIARGHRDGLHLKVGSCSETFTEPPEPVDFVLNGAGASPHIALMGRNGSGKTRTGAQIAREIVERASVPLLFIDPKGEFVDGPNVVGELAEFATPINPIEVGASAIPLDFLPNRLIGRTAVGNAAMQFRDSISACSGSVGEVQRDRLRAVVEEVIEADGSRDLKAVRDRYARRLEDEGKPHDSILSRLNELTRFSVFEPVHAPGEFFEQSWVISLKALGTEELKRATILLLLDALRTYRLSQSEASVETGYRELRHLLVVDEARRVLADKRAAALSDLVRQSRSKGQVIMLLSQDPSDFQGQADDFMQQIGTFVAFSCAQTKRGLSALQGAFGRKIQSHELSDVYLPPGVAFVKLPERQPLRVRCWVPPHMDALTGE